MRAGEIGEDVESRYMRNAEVFWLQKLREETEKEPFDSVLSSLPFLALDIIPKT